METTSQTYQNKDWLFAQYITKGRSLSDIAKERKVNPATISYFVRKHGLGGMKKVVRKGRGSSDREQALKALEERKLDVVLKLMRIDLPKGDPSRISLRAELSQIRDEIKELQN